MRTMDGWTVSVTTRYDTIRVTVRDLDRKLLSHQVFSVAESKSLENMLKAAREKIARKRAKKVTR